MIDKHLWGQMGHRKGLLVASSLCGVLCAVANVSHWVASSIL